MAKSSRKVALITGSASGVGAATARLLAGRGYNVVINYSKSEAEAHAVAEDCRKAGAEALVCRADVSADADCRRMVDETVAKWGRIDVLVNSAGWTKFVHHADLEGLSSEDFLRTLQINLLGPFQMVRAAQPHLKAAGNAAVVNVSSVAGINAGGSSIAYSTSKAGLNNLTAALARVLGPEIRVNAVCPAFIAGRWLVNGMGQERYDAYKANLEKTAPLRHATQPEEVAEHILWFIEGAKLVTGQVLVTDCGFSLGQAPAHSAAGAEKNREAAKAR